MKRLLLVAFALTVFQFSYAQTAEEIVDKYIKAIGGKKKLESVNTIHFTFKIINPGMEFEGEQLKEKNGRELVKIIFQGREFYQPYFDGKKLRSTNFMTMKLEEEDSETLENYINNDAKDLIDPFFNYNEKGYKIEKLGDKNKEGVDCYTIKLTMIPKRVNGEIKENIEYYYFDKDNYIPVMSEGLVEEGYGAGKMTQSVYSNFEEVDGIYFPFSISNKMDGEENSSLEIKKIVINEKFSDADFQLKIIDED